MSLYKDGNNVLFRKIWVRYFCLVLRFWGFESIFFLGVMGFFGIFKGSKSIFGFVYDIFILSWEMEFV